MRGTCSVKWDPVVENVVAHMGKRHDEAIHNLETQQQQRGGKEPPGNALGFKLHFCTFFCPKNAASSAISSADNGNFGIVVPGL